MEEKHKWNLTCIGSISSAANSTIRASRISWWVLKMHWTNRLGWQLWLINLVTLPQEPASIQNSDSLSSILTSTFFRGSIAGADPSPFRLCKKIHLYSIANEQKEWKHKGSGNKHYNKNQAKQKVECILKRNLVLNNNENKLVNSAKG